MKIFVVFKWFSNYGGLIIMVMMYLIIGGVFVSFVFFGDYNFVELGVFIGFVGCWVIE